MPPRQKNTGSVESSTANCHCVFGKQGHSGELTALTSVYIGCRRWQFEQAARPAAICKRGLFSRLKQRGCRLCTPISSSLPYRKTEAETKEESTLLLHTQTCAKIPKRSGILDLQDPGSGILEGLGSYIFFFRGILNILDPVMATFSRDPKDIGYWTEKILLDPGDPGFSLIKLSWDPADLGPYRTISSLLFEHPLHPM